MHPQTIHLQNTHRNPSQTNDRTARGETVPERMHPRPRQPHRSLPSFDVRDAARRAFSPLPLHCPLLSNFESCESCESSFFSVSPSQRSRRALCPLFLLFLLCLLFQKKLLRSLPAERATFFHRAAAFYHGRHNVVSWSHAQISNDAIYFVCFLHQIHQIDTPTGDAEPGCGWDPQIFHSVPT